MSEENKQIAADDIYKMAAIATNEQAIASQSYRKEWDLALFLTDSGIGRKLSKEETKRLGAWILHFAETKRNA